MKYSFSFTVIVLAITLFMITRPREIGDATFNPSWLTQTLFTSDVTDYDHTVFPSPYSGALKILVVGTERSALTMANGNMFNTGNHPVETLVPLLHMRAAGFDFEIATPTGKPLAFEMWALPTKDVKVMALYDELKEQLAAPTALSSVSESLEEYAGVFIPGGHGAMNDLPSDASLGKLLRAAHARALPTLTLCHGPSALLAAAVGAPEDEKFSYEGYELVVFPDTFDKITPWLGYLPGPMPWLVAEGLTDKGVRVMNAGLSGATHQFKELVTGDSPDAANAFGKLAAEQVLEYVK